VVKIGGKFISSSLAGLFDDMSYWYLKIIPIASPKLSNNADRIIEA
jgi:hypothetical protein